MKNLFERTWVNLIVIMAISWVLTGCDPEDNNVAKFTITPKAGAHGKIYPDAPKVVEKSTVHTFIVTPEKGYAATAIGCGGTLDLDVYTTQPITLDCTIQASFSLSTDLSFTVTPSAGKNGKIDPSKPLEIENGSTTTFTVTPDTGYVAMVTGCGGTLVGDIYTTRPITANCPVNATFISSTEVLTVTPKAGLHGRIEPSTPQSVQKEAVISFKVIADEGYTAIVEGCGGVLNRDSYQTSPITTDCTINARFETSTADTGDINSANAKKVLDTALVALIVVQTNTSTMYIDHLVNGPSHLQMPGLTRKVGDEIPCDDLDARFPVLNTGLSRLSDGTLSRSTLDAPFEFSVIRLIDFNGSPVCNLGSGSPGTMSNLLDGGPATAPNVSITISSKGEDWLAIENIITPVVFGYAYGFNQLPMMINLGSPQSLIVSGLTTTTPSIHQLTMDWTNPFGELDTIKVVDQYDFAPPYSETRNGLLHFQMSSVILDKVLTVSMPQLVVTKEPTNKTGAYALADYQNKEIMTVSSVVDTTGITLLCRELYPADTNTGFYCKSFDYKLNNGEAKSYTLP